jgi:hypothetical protein
MSMSEITEGVARRLRMRGYDAVPGSWDGLDDAAAITEFVAVNAIFVIGWRYPGGEWQWDDRPAYLIDKGADPRSRVTHPPYFDSSHRWDWIPSRPGKAEEHPDDAAAAIRLAEWVQQRLPAPRRPDVLLFWHPNDVEHPAQPGAESNLNPSFQVWPWTEDWERAWAEAEAGES